MRSPDHSRISHFLTALCLSAGLVFAFPAAAQSLPEVQRLVKQGQYPQALEQVDAFLATNARDAQGRFYKGLILAELNRTSEAIAVFTHLTEDYPELPEPYNNLAVLYAQQEQYDRARLALEKAIRTHPAYAVAYENLGDVYARLASQAYNRALQLNSSNAVAQNKLALISDLVSAPGARPPTVAATPPKTTQQQPTATVASTTPGAVATPAKPPPVVVPPPPNIIEPPPPPIVVPPTSQPSTPAVSTSHAVQEAEAERMVLAWADAWSRRDTTEYLSHYAPGFKTPGGVSRKAWEEERKARIQRPAWIKVSLDNIGIKVDGDRARVEMRQSYRAPNFKGDSYKVLVLTRSGNRWQILEETVR